MDQLLDLKSYIANTVVWMPVLVAIIAALGSVTCVLLNNAHQRKMTLRKERLDAYCNLLAMMFASLADTTKTRGAVLTYEDMCLCYSNLQFWTALSTVQLLGTPPVLKTCAEIRLVLSKEITVSRERLLELFSVLHKQMIEDVNETLKKKKTRRLFHWR